VHQRGQKFLTNDEPKHSILHWLCSQNKTFYVGTSNLPEKWKKGVSAKGEYPEKE
jgi:hypothetical protein